MPPGGSGFRRESPFRGSVEGEGRACGGRGFEGRSPCRGRLACPGRERFSKGIALSRGSGRRRSRLRRELGIRKVPGDGGVGARKLPECLPGRCWCRGAVAETGSFVRGRLYAESRLPSPDISRRGMSWKICRFSAVRPEPRSAQEPPELALFRRLFRSSSSVDHQMTPALFVPLFRACALSRHSLADWLSGTPSAALRPKASRSC